ncbi:MAG: CoA transferase [Alphaproteobacteria bacterium]|nr:CoA transferase [Alphaproteobacteria bacterium]PHX99262.1 MAG: formyl-CoA transferase [Rhodospirillaceae bacterium]
MAGENGPLTGLRLIEMGQLLAGPFCGQLMADFGAEVIKIEQPKVGDPLREWGREKSEGKSLWWPIVARNKKSITLNARVPEGQEIIKQLVKKSDFLLENFKPTTMEKWNLGYEELAKINPGIIMIRVSGYGQTGPYSHKAGYAAVGEAMGGLRYVVGDPSTPPSRVGISLGDTTAATYACMGALMALHHRHLTGRGQVVDSAIYESVLQLMESLISEYDKVGFIRERTGSILPNVAPSNVYPAKDGNFLIAANQDTVFRRLAEAMGQPELGTDARYATHAARGQRQKELDDVIAAWTKTKTVKELEGLMDKASVPSGLIYRAPEMLADAHFKAREAIVEVADKTLGKLKMQNTFPKLSATPGKVRWTGPDLGEHNEEIFGGILGMDSKTMKEYQERGII